jgi:hypothetical protein
MLQMSFGSDLEQFEVKTVLKGREALQKISMDLFKSVILMSPVGNPDLWKHPVRGYVGGRFKGNWQAGINSAPSGVLEDEDATGKKDESGPTIGKMIGTINGKVGEGDTVYLVNNLPYAQRLEEGWSTKQAPNGMVALSIQKSDGLVRKVGTELNAK